jgi:hypothetical protein
VRGLAAANLLLRFVLELIAVVIYGVWAYTVAPPDGALRLIITALVVVAVIIGWALLLAPSSRRSRLSRPQKDLVGTLVLLVAALLLWSIGHTSLAGLYATFVVVNAVLLFALRGESERWIDEVAPRRRRRRT